MLAQVITGMRRINVKKNYVKKYLPISILILGLVLFFNSKLYNYFSFSELQKHREFLTSWTEENYFLASIIFCFSYIISVAFSFPGAILLTLLGGFLFGIFFGSVFVILSATIGACLIFLATKTAFGNILEKKAGPFVKKFEKGFQENAVSYLLILRFVPLFPFWLINIVPALFNIRLRVFFITTFLGIIPGSVVYVSVGNGLGELFDKNQTPNLSIIFEPAILLPMIGLGLLSLVPVIHKKLKK